MEQGAVPTQRAKSSVLKFLQHRIVPSGCLAKRSTIGQDMHSPRASAIEQSAARKRTGLRTIGGLRCPSPRSRAVPVSRDTSAGMVCTADRPQGRRKCVKKK